MPQTYKTKRKNKKYVPKNRRRKPWTYRKQLKMSPNCLACKRVTYSDQFDKIGQVASAGSFSKWTDGYATIVTSANVGNHIYNVTQAFTFTDVIQKTDFSNLFDQFSIRKVIVRIQPLMTSADENTGYFGYNALLHYAIDHNDYATTTADEDGIDTIRQMASYKCVNILQNHGRSIKIVIKPHVAQAVYGGALTNGYSDRRSPWLDMDSSTDVEHYGLKMFFEMWNPTAFEHTIRFKWEATYYLMLRGIR